MFKVGEKVKFTEYYPDLQKEFKKFKKCMAIRYNRPTPETINNLNSASKEWSRLVSSIGGEDDNNIVISRTNTVKRNKNDIIIYENAVSKLEELKEGIFCGYKLKKVRRVYKNSDSKKEITGRLLGNRQVHTPPLERKRIKLTPSDMIAGRRERYNERLDNPYRLEKVALVSISPTKMLEVPMNNLLLNANKMLKFI